MSLSLRHPPMAEIPDSLHELRRALLWRGYNKQ